MTSQPILDYHAVVKIIAQWPLTERLMLAQNILNSLILEQAQDALPKDTLSQALGLLATDQPAPSDTEVQEWLNEHRLEKYG